MQLSDLDLPDLPSLDGAELPDWVGGDAAAVVPFRRPHPPKAPAKPADPIAQAIKPVRRKPKAKADQPPELADVLMQAIRQVRARRGRVTQAAAAREAALLDVLRELIAHR